MSGCHLILWTFCCGRVYRDDSGGSLGARSRRVCSRRDIDSDIDCGCGNDELICRASWVNRHLLHAHFMVSNSKLGNSVNILSKLIPFDIGLHMVSFKLHQ